MDATATARQTLIAPDHSSGDARVEPGFINDLRLRARARFDELGFPTRKMEGWRFTHLKRIAETPLVLATHPAEQPAIEPFSVPDAPDVSSMIWSFFARHPRRRTTRSVKASASDRLRLMAS